MTIRYYGHGKPSVDPYAERFMRRAVAGLTKLGYSGWRRNQNRSKRRYHVDSRREVALEAK
jgi:hypothetical protein